MPTMESGTMAALFGSAIPYSSHYKGITSRGEERAPHSCFTTPAMAVSTSESMVPSPSAEFYLPTEALASSPFANAASEYASALSPSVNAMTLYSSANAPRPESMVIEEPPGDHPVNSVEDQPRKMGEKRKRLRRRYTRRFQREVLAYLKTPSVPVFATVFENGRTVRRILKWRTPTLEETSAYFGGLGTSNVWRWKRNEAEIMTGPRNARAASKEERARRKEVQSLTDGFGTREGLREGEFARAEQDLCENNGNKNMFLAKTGEEILQVGIEENQEVNLESQEGPVTI
ncbi:hypothetical protein K440DRAFT_669332 [Wilcoxina mikolae CBS 423.85]|nr:hypothetical protein K440DRAFT_669332 [Wilcoxina mikolae CBS 423.85]